MGIATCRWWCEEGKCVKDLPGWNEILQAYELYAREFRLGLFDVIRPECLEKDGRNRGMPYELAALKSRSGLVLGPKVGLERVSQVVLRRWNPARGGSLLVWQIFLILIVLCESES